MALGARRGWIQGNDEAVRRYVRARVRADRRAQAEQGPDRGIIRKYLQLDDPELLEDQLDNYLAFAPHPPSSAGPGSGPRAGGHGRG